jgi:hypothetical protein
MNECLSRAQLRKLLRSRKHCVKLDDTGRESVYVWPRPDEIITVANEPDWTLREPYRQRYFICRPDRNGIPLVFYDERFRTEEPFSTIIREAPSERPFIRGPLLWLLSRVSRESQVVLWPADDFILRGARGFGAIVSNEETAEAVPHLAAWIKTNAADTSDTGAIMLNPRESVGAWVIWEVMNAVADEFCDAFVGVKDCSEVYLLHHHDCVVVSIPDVEKRRELFRELADQAELFEDYSGYLT